jgi:heptosyltransferase-1
MRVLIVRLGAFGDILHTLPLAADLHAAGHRIGWLCEDRWAPILLGSPVVARIHRLPRKAIRDQRRPLGERLIALRRLVREVRAHGYDAVIDAQGLAKSALLCAVSAAPTRVGHGFARARELSWLLNRRRTPVAATHVIDQQRALGLPLCPGARARGPWRFALPAWTAERRWAEQWLTKAGVSRPWVLNVGAGWPTKVWPRGRQVEFLRALRARGQPALLAWGSHVEHDLAEEIQAEAGHGVLAPPTSIPQLAGIFAASAVVVSGDTGPLHLALALGVPAVGLFGPVPAERNGPRGAGYRVFQAPGAAWERRDVAKVDLGAIPAQQVVDAARAAITEAEQTRSASPA